MFSLIKCDDQGREIERITGFADHDAAFDAADELNCKDGDGFWAIAA